ncbi:MAG: SPFH domain-containing protein [Myxococcales bacterium]|nr:SPFH domain-containing protein [Myxococcales bacterium]
MAVKIPFPTPPVAGFVKYAVLAGIAGLFLIFLWVSTTVSIGPDEFGIRQVYFGPGKGLQQDIFAPGTHILVPGYERFHVFSRKLQLVEFNDDTIQRSEMADVTPSIHIQTSEGYRVVVDVTVAYRIVDPHKLITSVGPGRLFVTALVMPRADQVLRQKLGELNAEQFYSGPLRRQKALECMDLLTKELSPSGIAVWGVLVRHYSYDERYQEAIEQRKIQDQMVFKNRAESIAATEEAEKNRVLAEGKATIDVERERGTSEVTKITADYDLYSRKRIAEGDLLVELAKAQSKAMENDALNSAGASNLVGLKMADAIRNTQVIIVPTDGAAAMNPLDLERLTRDW